MKKRVKSFLAFICITSLLLTGSANLVFASDNTIVLTPETATGAHSYTDMDVVLEAGTYSELALSLTRGTLTTNGAVILDGNGATIRALSFSGDVAVNTADIEIIGYTFNVVGGDWRTPAITVNNSANVTLTNSKIYIHASGTEDPSYPTYPFVVLLGATSKLNLYNSQFEITDVITGSVIYGSWNAEVCLYDESLFNIHDITQARIQCFTSESNGSDGKVKLRAWGASVYNFDRYTPTRVLASGFHTYLYEGSTMNITNSNTAANSLSVHAYDSYFYCNGNVSNGITGDFYLHGNSLAECANNGNYGSYLRQCIIEDNSMLYIHDNVSHGIVFFPSKNNNNFHVRDSGAVLIVSNGATKSAGMSCYSSYRGLEDRRITLNLEDNARWYTSRANDADLGTTFSVVQPEPVEGAEPAYALVREIQIESNDRCTVDTTPLLNLDNYPGIPNLLFAEQGVEYALSVTPNPYNYIAQVSAETAGAPGEVSELPPEPTLIIGAEDKSRQSYEVEAAPLQRTIEISTGEGGSASYIGTGSYNADEDYIIEFLPEDGNAVKNVIINGVSMGSISSYTIPAFSTEPLEIEIEYDRASIVTGSIVGCCTYHRVLYMLGCIFAALKTVFGTATTEDYNDFVENGWGYVVRQYEIHGY